MSAPHPEEWLDIVDENDRPVGRASRREIHENNLPHRAAHLFLVDDSGQFLLQRRSDQRPTHPGRWDCSAAGHVLAGEDYEETIHRESLEEIGVALLNPSPVIHLEPSGETGWEWVLCYTARIPASMELKPQAEEVAELRWWSEEQLLHGLIHDPESFTPVFKILFFLWRETGFLIPEHHHDNWHAIAWGNSHQLQVQASLLEAAGFSAHVIEDQHWLAGSGTGFFSRKDPAITCLVVRRADLCETIALLYLSRPEEPRE